MSAPRTYDIRTVADFLSVPPNKRMRCLSEFRTWLRMHDDVQVLLGMTAPATSWDGVYRWVDDGRRDVKIQIQTVPR